MLANCGAAPEALNGGVGRQAPTAAGVPARLSTPRKGGGSGLRPSLRRQPQNALATRCPHCTPAVTEAALSWAAIAAIEASRCAFKAPLCAG